MPFVEGRAAYAHEPDATESTEVPRIHTDELRKAFNTPFWPYVLATTSVGQEGLDFHIWCDTIVHWDLCRNPALLHESSRARTMPTDRILTGRFDMTLVGRARSSD